MPSSTIRVTGSAGGIPASATFQDTGNISHGIDPTVAASKTATLTTRSDANTGTLTGQSGHGITTGATFDIYWTDGGETKCQRNAVAGTVSGTSIPFDSGVGDDLPAQTSSVTVALQTTIDVVMDGDELQSLNLYCLKGANFMFYESGTLGIGFTLQPGVSYTWSASSGIANPLAGLNAITKVVMSCGDATARQVKAGILHN